jgi:hypothetical protein
MLTCSWRYVHKEPESSSMRLMHGRAGPHPMGLKHHRHLLFILRSPFYKAGFAPIGCPGVGVPGAINCTHPISLNTHLALHLSQTYLILRPLRHHLRTLLLHNHLLLTIRQRPRHTQQKRTRAHDPQRLAAHEQARLEPRSRGADL